CSARPCVPASGPARRRKSSCACSLTTLCSLQRRRRVSTEQDRDRNGRPAPSVATVLQKAKVRPSEDIMRVLFLLFAFQHARSRRPGSPFFLDGWLVFRDIASPPVFTTPPHEELAFFHSRYLDAGPEGAECEQVTESLAALPAVDWRNHPGYQELCVLVAL